ncbi:MAG: lipid IV(A) 3-deoxy-D-manno-octulosonic acid transferase [Alcanivoracaceae bacterium]|jgi:3-deoxy-D-manno-octulosonic-acid transferase|nr:lipid IV(A) 3-deoxy-D-manno-octulosonic acid transferase [Alcanivoracaceae bacterium]
MRLLYTLLWYLLIPVVLVRFWQLGRVAPAYRQRWRERFALGYARRLDQCVWIHAVSVGEMLAAAPLVEALLERYPHTPLLITTTTPTGSERVRALFGNRVHHVYWPWDTPCSVRRFWRAFNPGLVILLETELWPNLVAAARARRVPVVLVNGRLSERSHRRYRRLAGLVRPMLASFEQLAVQTPPEAERFIDLGAQRQRVTVTGNVKFDIALDDSLRSRAARLREELGLRPVWIAASTHPGEEEVMLAAHHRLRQQYPDALLILVPRHQERFAQVAEQVVASGHSLTRRSSGQMPTAQTSVYLGDTMGELLMLYGAADIAFVAGSLAPIGGHNLLEPALWSKPVITGPVLHNFTLIAELLDAARAHRVVLDDLQLGEVLVELFGDEQQCQQMGERARQVVEQHRGALAALLTVLQRYWPTAG